MYSDTTNYGEIIKHFRKKYHLTQSELAERISVGKTAVSNYETGYSMPALPVLESIAAVFDMSLPSFLSMGNKDAVSSPRISQPVNDRVIRYIKEAHISENAIESDNYMDTYLTLPGFMLDGESGYICIKMPDDSMLGENIKRNDYVIIKKTSFAVSGKLILAIDRKTHMYMIRRYIREGHIINLIPSSSMAKHSILRADERDNEIAIIGEVEKIISSVK